MPETHIVNANDGLKGLWDISEYYGVSWDELKNMNPQFKDRTPGYWLNVGDRVLLPVKRWPNAKITDCKNNCPPYYLLVIKIKLASGKAHNGKPMTDYALPAKQYTVGIDFFFGFGDESYLHKKAPYSDGQVEYRRGQSQPLVRIISKDTFDRVRRIIFWTNDMSASFWKSGLHDGYAVGRIDIPGHHMTDADAPTHPISGKTLPKGSKQLIIEFDILEHPAQYILAEMIKNAHGNEAPTGEEYDGSDRYYLNQGFITLGLRWAMKAETGHDWDYKSEQRIGGVWGNYVRLGNDENIVFNDGFSNYHYGYVAAASGLPQAHMLKISELGGLISSPDTEFDIYAMKEGHRRFLEDQQNGGVIWVRELKVTTYIPVVYGPTVGGIGSAPYSVPTGESRLVNLTKEKQKSKMEKESAASSLFGPIYDGYEYRYIKQPIHKDPLFEHIVAFLKAYLQKYPHHSKKWDQLP